MSAKRGLFVVLEGADRAGKSTQCRRLVERLNSCGQPAQLVRFPERDSPIGGLIGQYLEKRLELDDRAVHLLFSANRWELSSRIVDAVTSGTHIVCDRYAYSGIAFTAAKVGGPQLEWCCQPEVGLPAPDVKIFLSVSADSQRSRGGFGDERYEVAEFQRRVAGVYRELMAAEDAAAAEDRRWRVVDADASADAVATRLAEIVANASAAPRPDSLDRLSFSGVVSGGSSGGGDF